MATTYYDTVNGELIGESTSGVTTSYLADELGSVVATAQAGAVVNTYRYWPYGNTIAKTGASADPKFTWVGSRGYRATSRTRAEAYIRARHYGRTTAVWTSRDPTWPAEKSYEYCTSSPAVCHDASGLACSMGITSHTDRHSWYLHVWYCVYGSVLYPAKGGIR